MELSKLQTLLEDFNNLPKISIPRKTFFDVSGYTHYENVCSNILEFFFEQSEQHSMKDLFLKSLLELLPEKSRFETDGINTFVSREYEYIDILIEADKFCIIIENKVGAPLHNDLKGYRKAVEDKVKDDNNFWDGERPKIIGIVLSLNPIHKDDEIKRMSAGEFDNITYKAFFDRIRVNLGNYIDDADGQWLIFLKNFISNINSLEGANLMDMNSIRETIKFLDENDDKISGLMELRKKTYDYFVSEELSKLKLMLEDAEDIRDDLRRDFHFEKLPGECGATVCCRFSQKDIFADGVFGGVHILHIARTVKGWEIYIILEEKKQLSNQVLLDLLEKKGSENGKVLSWKDPNRSSLLLWTCKTKDNDEITLREVADKSIEWIKNVIDVFSVK